MWGTLGTIPLEAPGLFITVTGHGVPYVSGCLLELLVLLPLLPIMPGSSTTTLSHVVKWA